MNQRQMHLRSYLVVHVQLQICKSDYFKTSLEIPHYSNRASLFEPQHDKNQQTDLCTLRGLRSAKESAQSDQSSLSAQCVAKDLIFLHADTEDWSESLLSAHVFSECTSHFVGFVVLRLICFSLNVQFDMLYVLSASKRWLYSCTCEIWASIIHISDD